MDWPIKKENSRFLETNLYSCPTNSCICTLFQELHLFRNSLNEAKNGLHHHPYTALKNKIFIYKTIFMVISALFGLIAYHIHNSYFCWAFTFFLGNQLAPKILLTNIALFFSFASFSLAIYITPIREIVNHIAKKAKRRIKKIYCRRNRAASCVNFSSPIGLHEIRNANRDTYIDITDCINSHKKESLLTMKRIYISKTLDESQKEQLYNQSILELQYKLEGIVAAYEKNKINPVS